ncbi:MAG: TetR/AcrR family transcriptional regulator [Ilumatobacteraceae bacterium]
MTARRPTGRSCTGARRLPRQERRAQLLGAAATAFLRAGYDGTSMEDVAGEAGVTRLIVYRNFGSKEDLYRAVLNGVTDRLADQFAGGVDGDAPGTDQIRPGIAERVVRVARADPDAFRLLWRHAAHEPTFAAEAAAFREIVTSYAAALIHPRVHDETFRAWAASALVGHLYDGVCAWLDTGDASRDDEFVRRLSAGLRALVTAWS